MRSFLLGLAIAAGLVLLLGAGLTAAARAGAQTAPSPVATAPGEDKPVTVSQAATFLLTATVGTDRTRCAATTTAQVRANTPVYYCLTIQNTGDLTLTTHTIRTARQGQIGAVRELNVAPDAVTNTVALGLVISEVVGTQDITNTTTWTARASNGAETNLTDLAVVDVVAPAISVVKTVGTNRALCPTTESLRVPSGQSVAFCLTVENTGDITFSRHTLIDTPLGINGTFAYTLAPQASLVITPGRLSSLGVGGFFERNSIISTFTNTAGFSATTAGGLVAGGSGVAVVSVGNTTVAFSKTVGTVPDGCPTTTSISPPPGSQLYYCAWIRNTGSVTLTHHQLVERQLSIDLSFDYTLTPGSLLTVTNATLTQRVQPPQPPLFGPFEFSSLYPTVINNTMTYTGTSSDGFRVQLSGSTSATFPPTPTPTRTDAPDPTDTVTPFPTWTPSNTPIPVPPTATPTPTFTPVTPSPTPTRSYLISTLATPTPSQPQALPTPFVDPAFFALTLTAEAATATAAAAPFFSPLEAPTPDLNAGQPTFAPVSPLEPPPFSPLEVPTFAPEPPTPAPPTDTPTAPPVALDTPTPPVTPTPLLPSPTLTPVVVLVVVTDTPLPGGESGAPLPAGQRPIVYPTPTPTADMLMITATMLDAAAVAAGWLWFFLGVVVFFGTAGLIVGLFFWRQGAHRYELLTLEEEVEAPPPPAASSGYAPPADESWPDNLP